MLNMARRPAYWQGCTKGQAQKPNKQGNSAVSTYSVDTASELVSVLLFLSRLVNRRAFLHFGLALSVASPLASFLFCCHLLPKDGVIPQVLRGNLVSEKLVSFFYRALAVFPYQVHKTRATIDFFVLVTFSFLNNIQYAQLSSKCSMGTN
jgi:hypothetical protein